MIIDVTGIELTPGNDGKDCLGNGSHYEENGELIECCCDECEFLLCCVSEYHKPEHCESCYYIECKYRDREYKGV